VCGLGTLSTYGGYSEYSQGSEPHRLHARQVVAQRRADAHDEARCVERRRREHRVVRPEHVCAAGWSTESTPVSTHSTPVSTQSTPKSSCTAGANHTPQMQLRIGARWADERRGGLPPASHRRRRQPIAKDSGRSGSRGLGHCGLSFQGCKGCKGFKERAPMTAAIQSASQNG
jgi:hypothetical protein